MSTADAERLAPIFAALGDPTRLDLLRVLSGGEPRSIAALTAHRGLTRQAVTKHLRVLERAGLVRQSRSGRENRFVCRPERLVAAQAYLEAVSARWDDSLARLRAHVEQTDPQPGG